MNFSAVNFLAVFVVAILHMVLGFLWYGPLFSKPWTKLMGMTEEQLRQANPNPAIYMIPFIGALVSAYVLALLIGSLGLTGPASGAGVGLLMGLGIFAPPFAANSVFGGKSFKLFLIDAGYPVISFVIMGAILGVW
jgi:hypothetical protein